VGLGDLRGRSGHRRLGGGADEGALAITPVHVRAADGDFFGEIAILGGGRRTASVTVTEPVTAWKMFGTAFREMQQTRPDVAAAERITEPLGLSSTYFAPDPTRAPIGGLSNALPGGDKSGVSYRALETAAGAAGALVSTPADLAAFLTWGLSCSPSRDLSRCPEHTGRSYGGSDPNGAPHTASMAAEKGRPPDRMRLSARTPRGALRHCDPPRPPEPLAES